MKILIRSKKEFDHTMQEMGITNDNVEKYKKAFFISINDTCGTDEIPYFENKENVKVLFFDDIEKDLDVPIIGTSKIYSLKAFTIEQAKELLEFINKHKDKEICVIHCAAGISRSGAIGTFINNYFKGDILEFKKNNPYISPNKLVIKLLEEAIL